MDNFKLLTDEEYRTAWIEAEYIVAGWWIPPKPQQADWEVSRVQTD